MKKAVLKACFLNLAKFVTFELSHSHFYLLFSQPQPQLYHPHGHYQALLDANIIMTD